MRWRGHCLLDKVYSKVVSVALVSWIVNEVLAPKVGGKLYLEVTDAEAVAVVVTVVAVVAVAVVTAAVVAVATVEASEPKQQKTR